MRTAAITPINNYKNPQSPTQNLVSGAPLCISSLIPAPQPVQYQIRSFLGEETASIRVSHQRIPSPENKVEQESERCTQNKRDVQRINQSRKPQQRWALSTARVGTKWSYCRRRLLARLAAV